MTEQLQLERYFVYDLRDDCFRILDPLPVIVFADSPKAAAAQFAGAPVMRRAGPYGGDLMVQGPGTSNRRYLYDVDKGQDSHR